jgi:hypothetical protein
MFGGNGVWLNRKYVLICSGLSGGKEVDKVMESSIYGRDSKKYKMLQNRATSMYA